MDRDRFTELLNLYLDDEITPSQLTDLMEETRRHPDRQKLFLDYCRIHKACSLMGDRFGGTSRKRSLRQMAYAIGGLAAAFTLLAMASRNLLPLIEGGGSTAVVQQGSDETVRYPEFAASEVLSIQKPANGAAFSARPVAFTRSSLFNSINRAERENRLRLQSGADLIVVPPEAQFARDILNEETGDLPDEFDLDSYFENAETVEFPVTQIVPTSSFDFEIGLESRLSLK